MGRIAGEVMVRQHRPETAWTLHLLDIQPTDTVLEVGFGAGQGIKLAAERVTSGRIRGIDLSEEMVRVATRRNASAIKAGRVALSQGSITALPFESVNPNIKLVLLQQLFWWVSSSRDLCSPEYLLDFRHNTVGIYRQVNLAESHSDNAGLRVGAGRASR